MSAKETILQLIEQKTVISVPITETTDLYQDLYLDSLSFVCLLMDIEQCCTISIELSEIPGCRIFGNLIELVEKKIEEAKKHD